MDTKEIGAHLRQQRKERGLRVGDIAQILHIRRKFLIAMEDGRFEELPPSPYREGFMRKYSGYLGLDPEEVLGRFRQHLAEVEAARVAEAAATAEVEAPTRKLRWMPRGALLVAIMVIVAGILWGVSQLQSQPPARSGSGNGEGSALGSDTPQPQEAGLDGGPLRGELGPVQADEVLVEAPIQTSGGPTRPETAPGEEPVSIFPLSREIVLISPFSPEKPLYLELEVIQDTVIWVTADGEAVFQGPLEAGERREFIAQRGLFLRASNGRAVRAELNRELSGFLGREPEIVDKVFRLEIQESEPDIAVPPTHLEPIEPEPVPPLEREAEAEVEPRPRPRIAVDAVDDFDARLRTLQEQSLNEQRLAEEENDSYRLANYYFFAGDYQSAAHFYEIALQERVDPRIYIELALALEQIGELDRVPEVLEQGTEDFPDNYLLYWRLAEFYEQIGQPQRAEQLRLKAESLFSLTFPGR